MAEDVEMPIGERDGKKRFRMGPEFEARAKRNHGQTLARLAQRGGLGWCEGAAIVQDRAWHRMDSAAARTVVYSSLQIVEADNG